MRAGGEQVAAVKQGVVGLAGVSGQFLIDGRVVDGRPAGRLARAPSTPPILAPASSDSTSSKSTVHGRLG
jgi:hypothetical protein